MKREELLKYFDCDDKKLSSFAKSLNVNDKYEILGIRTPILRKLGKTLAKQEGLSLLDDFFNYSEVPYYEEVLLMYFTYAGLSNKLDFDTNIYYLDKLLKYNNSWATNDALVTTLSIRDEEKSLYWSYLLTKISSSYPFDVRFAIITFMSYFLDEEYTVKGLNLITETHWDHYYINMAVAWTMATALAKQRLLTLPFYFENKGINPKVMRMAINKAIESYRVSNEDKETLKERRNELKCNIVEF